jgi:poly(A) polymerase
LDKIRDLIKESIKNTEFENNTFSVGGYVRDQVMNRQSASEDMDIVVSLPEGGIKLANYLYSTGVCSKPVVFVNFGTAMVKMQGYTVEFVMTRKESYRDKSRKPDVQLGTIKDDIFRRDFTINSLIQNVISGEIIDISGYGLSDINDGIIRATSDPNIIFVEDPLRTLRAIRFAARFNFKIEEETANGMKKYADRLQNISKERIKDEISKIMVGENIGYALNLMLELNIMNYVFPELTKLKNLEQNKYHFADVWDHTVMVVENSPADLEIRMAALFHDIGKQCCMSKDEKGIHFYGHDKESVKLSSRLLTELKFPKIFVANVSILIKNHMCLKSSGKNGEILTDKKLRKIYHQLGDFVDKLLDLIHADNISHAVEYNLPGQVSHLRERLKRIKDEYSLKPFPLSGHDIMEAFRIKEGEIIGEWMTKAKDLWLEHPDWNKQRLIEELRK